MSVIPLSIDGPDRTVVTDQGDFDIEGRAVLIQGADSEQFQDLGTSNVSYDLRVGQRFRQHRERAVKQLSDKSVIRLRPGAAIIIETAEYLHLPRSMYGSIAPKVSLLQLGLSSTYSKIDPGYRGHLLITLFNLGKATLTLKMGQPFCSLTLLEVAEGARLYNRESKQISAQPAGLPRKGAREWLEGKHIYLTLALVMAALWTPVIRPLLLHLIQILHHIW